MIYAYEVIDYLIGYCLDTLGLLSSETVTANATTDEITVGGGYPYDTGDRVKFSGVDIPLPLVSTEYYYIIDVSATKIKLALTAENAAAGTSIDLTDSGSGTITMSKYDYEIMHRDWIQKRIDNFIVPWIERVTRSHFSGTQQIVEYYSGTGSNLLILNRRPIVSLDKIEYVLGGSNITILNLGNIETIYAEGILKAKRNYEESYYLPVFAKAEKNIKVTYTYGTASAPGPIREAAIYLAAEKLLGHIGASTGGGNVGTQGYNKTYGVRGKYQDERNDLSRQAMALLKPYMTGLVGS